MITPRKVNELIEQGKTVYKVYGFATKFSSKGSTIDFLLQDYRCTAYYLSFSHAKRLMKNKACEWFDKGFNYDLYIKRLSKDNRLNGVISRIEWTNAL